MGGLLARHLPLASEASEDDGMDTEDDDVDELEIEMGAERAADRAAFSEDQKWEGIVVSSTCQGSRQASQVLMREMRMLLHLQGEGKEKALEIDMVDNSLYHWIVKMHAESFPNQCALKKQLRFDTRKNKVGHWTP